MGFLADAPLHGYELRRRVAALTGHVRPIADGTLDRRSSGWNVRVCCAATCRLARWRHHGTC